MQQRESRRRRAGLATTALVMALSAGAAGMALVEVPIQSVLPLESISINFAGLANTGFRMLSADGSLFTLSGSSKYDPDIGLQPGETVQEGFVLLDGTLSVDVSALRDDGTPARYRSVYRMDVPRRALRAESLARRLVRQGVVRGPDPARTRAVALKRARTMRLDDARIMRLVTRPDGGARWVRAVRTLGIPDQLTFRPRQSPDAVLGHFGTTISDFGDSYVWAVLDRNSRFAVGITVDRDNDGVPNASDNCIGTVNPNQSNADADAGGDACDVDDDNDEVLDEGDNCPLAVNTDQADLDGDSLGDACDFDDDNDNVTDGADRCLTTAAGGIVDVNGCAIADHCPCESEWRNHGAYARCVARTSESFVSVALIDAAQKDAIVSASAQSTCGVK